MLKKLPEGLQEFQRKFPDKMAYRGYRYLSRLLRKRGVTPSHPLVFLVDVDNTLLDNDAIQQDLKDHLERAFGVAVRDHYWQILEDLFDELGYRDYIGALQRYRAEHPHEVELLSMSSFLMDYPSLSGCSRPPSKC